LEPDLLIASQVGAARQHGQVADDRPRQTV
jgi:hypothetical protein